MTRTCLPISSDSGASWIARTFHRTTLDDVDVDGVVDAGDELSVDSDAGVDADVVVVAVVVVVADVSVEGEDCSADAVTREREKRVLVVGWVAEQGR